MPAQRLSMRHVTEVLRLKWSQGLSDRKIAQSLGISRPTVAEYGRRAQAAGLSWPMPARLDETAVERLLFPPHPAIPIPPRPEPDWPTVHHDVSSLPIMVKGEQFLRVIGIFTLYVATIKLAYNENNP